MTARTHLLFWAALLVVLSAMSGTFLACVVELDKTIGTALGEVVGALFNGFAIPILYIPAALIAFMSAAVARRRSVKLALIPFVIGMVPLTIMYAVGHWDSAIAISQRKWTAAGLSIGFLPFFGIVWVVTSGLSAVLALQATGYFRARSAQHPG